MYVLPDAFVLVYGPPGGLGGTQATPQKLETFWGIGIVSRRTAARIMIRFGAATAAFALAFTGTFASAALAQQGPADLEVSASFEKASYDSTETIRATLTIKNVGGAAAEKVRVGTSAGSSGYRPDNASWGDIAQVKPGIRIEAGATHVVQLTGKVTQVVDNQLVLNGQIVTSSPESNKTNNTFDAKATVVFGTGGAAFTVYGDANGNSAPDAGEGLAGVKVRLTGPANNSREQELLTGPDGKAVFSGLPSGSYRALYEGVGGWEITSDADLLVETGKQFEVVRKADRSVADRLEAKLEFDKDSYAAGESIGITVTLKSKGPAIPVVHAFCSGPGESYELYNTDDSWGDLRYEGPGVQLGAGETKVVKVSAKIPEGASNYGFVAAYCVFGPENEGGEGYPEATDSAKIPGENADASGTLLKEGDLPLAATKIVLVDTGTTHPVASATTDAEGKFEFKGVPAGRYDPVVVGPWKLADGKDNLFRLVKDQPHVHDLLVVPGPEVVDPETLPTTTTTPPPTSSSSAPVDGPNSDNLASTGASVIGLTLLGLVVLAAGTAIVIVVRRRRAAKSV